MMRILVVANNGAVLAAMTATLRQIPGVDIAAYANGRAPVDRVIRAVRPDAVLIEEMQRPALAVARINEACAADPDCVVIGLAERADSSWLIDALHAGASAVVPRDLAPELLGQVLHESFEAAGALVEPARPQAA